MTQKGVFLVDKSHCDWLKQTGRRGLYNIGHHNGQLHFTSPAIKTVLGFIALLLLTSIMVQHECDIQTDGCPKCQEHTATIDAYQLKDHN